MGEERQRVSLGLEGKATSDVPALLGPLIDFESNY